jgi:cell shape-determining protein MreD
MDAVELGAYGAVALSIIILAYFVAKGVKLIYKDDHQQHHHH